MEIAYEAEFCEGHNWDHYAKYNIITLNVG